MEWGSDVELARACARADPAALAAFEQVLGAVRPAIASLGASAAEIDEVLQRVRVQLLVGDPPGIAGYAGRGELRAWVRVIAVRETVRLRKSAGRTEPLDDERLLESLLPAVSAIDAARNLSPPSIATRARENTHEK